jgi:hypothetical protein
MRKIAIVGRAATHVFAPWHDKEWEIWGMPWISYPRVDRLFEIHDQESTDLLPPESGDPSWLPKAQELYPDIPVYCDPSRMWAFKTAIEYPLEEIKAFLPILSLETTISYMIAQALYEGVDEIGLFGIHMMGRGEFQWQRPSVTYLVGLAQGRGVKVTIPPGCPLFMSGYIAGRYGPHGGARYDNIKTGPHGVTGTLSDINR